MESLSGWLIIETDNRQVDKIPIEEGWQCDGAYGMIELLLPREVSASSEHGQRIVAFIHDCTASLLSQLASGNPVATCNEFVGTILPFSA